MDQKYFTYILQSIHFDKLYIGHTNNLKSRIERHNNGYERFTKKYLPWKLMFFQVFESRAEAAQLERKLKKSKNKKFILKWADEHMQQYPI